MPYSRKLKTFEFLRPSGQAKIQGSPWHLRGYVLVALIVVAGFYIGSKVINAQATNLIVNGGFEEPVITSGFEVFSSIPGWTVLPGRPVFELQSGVAGDPFEGNQHCELDGFTPTAIFQDVPTVPGRVYELSFAFSARPGTSLIDNVLRVSWGGQEITTLAEDGTGLSNTSWRVHRFQVFAGPVATTRLIFEDLGIANTFGTYIDDVRLVDLGLTITTSLPRHIQLGVPFSMQLQAGGGQAPLTWSLVAGTMPTGLNLGAGGLLSGMPTEPGQFSFTVGATDVNDERAEKIFTVEVVLVLPPPDISIRKTGMTVVPGRLTDYFIIVENKGQTRAANLVVRELLDPLENFSDPSLFIPIPAVVIGNLIEWQIDHLEPGDSRILMYRVTISSNVTLGEVVKGQAFQVCDQCKDSAACRNLRLACDFFSPDLIPSGGFLSDIFEKWFNFNWPSTSCTGFTSQCAEDCKRLCPNDSHDRPAQVPQDPNEKLVVAKRFIQPDQLLIYPIHFENIGNIEARDVFITDVLDANLDFNTLDILTPGATFDPITRTLRWELLNRNLPPGETDNVLLSVKPVQGLPSGTVIRNKAEIQFEIFEPLVTPEVMNIIDTSVPTCTVDPLPGQVFSEDFRITWSGSDAVGEIESFTIFVQKDGGNLTRFIETSGTEAMFHGVRNSTYGFFCVAKDTAGNIENQTLAAETMTTIQECTYSISPANQNFIASGGMGSVSVTTPSGCGWTATSNDGGFITITSGSSGNGNGAVNFTISANVNFSPRMGTITIAGQIFTVTQDAFVCPAITINPSTVANGFVGTAYSQVFTQTGGMGAINWSSTGSLPNGLMLNASTGELAGTPTMVGSFIFTIKATDANNCMGTREYTVVVSVSGLQYYPLSKPIRLFDTRAPIPGFPACEYLGQPLVADGELVKNGRITCDGETIPASAAAIVGNATVVNPSTGGFITLWPDGQMRPPVSNLNFSAGQTVPNAFTVSLSSAGDFRVYSTSDANFIVDITGYFAPPSANGLYYHPLPKPIRLFDTRAPIPGFVPCEYSNQMLVGGNELAKQARITCDGITIPDDAMVIVGNATVVNPAGSGFITLWPDGNKPPVSNLNYVTGQTVPNSFTVGLAPDGRFRIYSVANTNFIVDITGYYSSSPLDINGVGLLFSPLAKPIRLFDTRVPIPGFAACEYLSQPLVADGELVKTAHTTCGGITIPSTAAAIVGNATVVQPLGNGFITLWPDGQMRPPVSNLNYVAGQTVANAFTVGMNASGNFRIYSFAETDFIIDLAGFFFAPAAPVNLLVNGSFEIGPSIPSGSSFRTLGGGSTAITGWVVTGATIDYIGPSWAVSDGIRAVDLDGNSSIGGIQQTFSTVPGQTYLVSFDLSGNPDGPPQFKQLRVAVDGFSQDYSFDTQGQTRSTLIWENESFSFVASGTTATLWFRSLSSAGNSYGALIDNVSVSLLAP